MFQFIYHYIIQLQLKCLHRVKVFNLAYSPPNKNIKFVIQFIKSCLPILSYVTLQKSVWVFFFFFNIYLFTYFWLRCARRARGIFPCSAQAQLLCSMWDPSSPTRDRTCIPCIGRQILNHWTTREVPQKSVFKDLSTLKFCFLY